ncbi:MAG TPA: N-acetylmuramoyl-L-alanine amidase [Desulfobacteraceae bacterium]|nr:N-acetylmuramoyl-L-alanine amidase [Desulfobacteraceae bacterium]
MKCINSYHRLISAFPGSDQAVWGIYHSARLYTGLYEHSGRSKDLDEAISLYSRIVDEYKDHRLADDAQYRIGEIYYEYRKDTTRAYIEFLKVDIKFPAGDMRPKAKEMLDRIAVALNKNEDIAKSKDISDSGPKRFEVDDIRYWSTPNYTRVVVDLQGPVKYEHNLLKADPDLKKPRRLYLDLQNARVTSKLREPIIIKDGMLQRARAAQYTKETVRVVLDIEDIERYKVFHLYDPFRIVVDVMKSEKDDASESAVAISRPKGIRKGIRKAEAPDDNESLAKQLGLKVKRIVIDPGHGGRDPGCNAASGVKEKDIVLSLAKHLAEEIEEKLGCEVELTRAEDIFMPLERRTAIANMKKADLFISLHVNAHRNKSVHGLETYFLNIATDRNSVMVAARENATSEKNISDLQTILNDLMLNTKINESSRLAHEIQNGLVSQVKLNYKQVKDLGVKQAPFYVLIGAQMPAVLVEVGFITNSTERKRILSSSYQKTVAKGICSGIKKYIESIDQAYKGG